MKKRILSMLLVIVLVLSMVPVLAMAEDGGEQGSVAPAELEVYQQKSKTSVKVGGNVNLTVRMTDGSKPGTVTWSDEPKGLVELTCVNPKTVKVNGKAAGSVTIMATNANGLTDTYELTVVPGATATATEATTAPAATTAPDATTATEATQTQQAEQAQSFAPTRETPSNYAVGDFKINGEDSVLVDESVTLTAKTIAASIPVTQATWTVEQETAAYPGKVRIEGSNEIRTVTGLKTGMVRITAKSLLGRTATFELEVKKNTFAAIQFTDGTTKMSVGESKELIALDKGDGEISGVTWAVEGNGAVLDGNTLTVDEVGFVTVTASKDGYYDKPETITVEVADLESIDVENYPASGEMFADDKLGLVIQYYPSNATDKSFTWETSDKAVAEVKNGKLCTYKAGPVTLTAMQGATVLCTKHLIVTPGYRIELDSNLPEKVYVGESVALKAKLLKNTNNAEVNGAIEWSFEDPTDGNFADLIDGKLVPKHTLIGQQTVYLMASVKGDKFGAVPMRYEVTLVPRAKSITLRIDGKVVNNKEYDVNALGTAGVTIQAEIDPDYAEQAVDWQISGTAGIFNKDDDILNELTLTPNGTKNTGDVKITAVAADGSAVSATTTIRFVREGESFLKAAPQKLRGGASLNMADYLEQDKNMTDKTVTWGLKDTPDVVKGRSVATGKLVASIGKNGRLTTKPVTDVTEIIVTMKGTVGTVKEHPITLYPATTSIKITSDELTSNTIELKADKADRQFRLKASVKPQVLEDRKAWDLVWSSTNEDVATVNSKGLLTVKKAGKVRIDCMTTDGSKIKGSLNLEVVTTANSVTVTPDGRKLASGESLDMKAVVTTDYRKAANQRVTWSIADEFGRATSAAIISSNGRVTAKDVDRNTVVVVTATSAADKEVFGTALLTIVPNTTKTLHAFINGELISGTYTMNLNEYVIVDAKWQKSGKNVSESAMKPAEDCQFFSSNTKVATVEDGILTAVGYGSSTITLRWRDPDSNSEYTATFTLRVANKVSSVTIGNRDDRYLRSGESAGLSATTWNDFAKGIKAENQGVTWEVTENGKKTDIATINANGVLTAKALPDFQIHTVEVKAFSKENPSIASKAEKFYICPAEKVKTTFVLGGEEYTNTLPVDFTAAGDQLKLGVKAYTAFEGKNYVITTATPAVAGLTWKSSNDKVIKVESNVLKLVAVGNAKLTASFKIDGKSYSVSITALVNRTVGKISIDGPDILASGKSINLSVTGGNEDATNRNMIWSVVGTNPTGNEGLVSINRYTGQLSAKRGITSRFSVTVKADPVDGSGDATKTIQVYPATTKVQIKSGAKVVNGTRVDVSKSAGTVSFTVTTTPALACQDFEWTSSDTNVATVDASGKVTIKKIGRTKITATAKDGTGKNAKFTLRVTN